MTTSVLLDAFSSVTIAADAVLALSDPFTFTIDADATLRLRMYCDLGAVHLSTGTAGKANIGAAFYLQDAAVAAPTSAAAKSFGWGARYMRRDASHDQTWPLGAGMLEQDVPFTAGDWELYLAIVVEGVGDLNGVTCGGYTGSGFITLAPPGSSVF